MSPWYVNSGADFPHPVVVLVPTCSKAAKCVSFVVSFLQGCFSNIEKYIAPNNLAGSVVHRMDATTAWQPPQTSCIPLKSPKTCKLISPLFASVRRSLDLRQLCNSNYLSLSGGGSLEVTVRTMANSWDDLERSAPHLLMRSNLFKGSRSTPSSKGGLKGMLSMALKKAQRVMKGASPSLPLEGWKLLRERLRAPLTPPRDKSPSL